VGDNPKHKPIQNVQNLAFPSFDQQDKDKQLIADAKQKAAAIERRAYEQGFHKGEAAGIEMGLAKALPSVENFVTLVEHFNHLLLETLAAMEPEIIRLVLLIAEKVIRTTLAEDDEVLQRVVKAALKEVDERWEATIRINPNEYEMIKQSEAHWQRTKNAELVKLIADPAVAPGGCIVETPQGFVDASLDTALERVAKIGD